MISSFLKSFITQKVLPHSGVPLATANLCLDCDTIYDHRGNSKCPSCASAEFMVLSKLTKPLFNRE